jgi:uncharacterized protein DUF3307
MIQLLCHLYGDFILQNHWMANKKVEMSREGWLACTLHVIFYMLPFFIAYDITPLQFTVMAGTHFLIDKFRLAKYVQMLRNFYFRGNGTPNAPDYLGVWLLFITDNILHVTINYLSLTYL